MAVWREIIQFLLPFPRAVYAHDHWMALVAGVLGGVVFLENELTFYRQHGKNLTPKYRRQVLEVILSPLRLLLLMNVAIARRIRSWKTAG